MKLVEVSGRGQFLVIHDQQYRTGGVPKISIDGIGGETNASDRFIKRVFKSREPIEKRQEWIRSYEAEFLDESDIDVLSAVFDQIDNLIKPKSLVDVDELLERLPSLRLSYEVKAAILTYTYGLRANLPSWSRSYGEVREDIVQCSLDADGIFAGLKA